MNSSAKKIKVFGKGGLKVSEEMILVLLVMLRRLKTADANLPVPQPIVPAPLFADRPFFRPLIKPRVQKDIVKQEFQPKSEDKKIYLKKLPIPDKVQYLGLRSKWSPLFKIAMCFTG